MNGGRFLAAVAIVTALLPGAVADARRLPPLHTLRLDGYVGDPPEGHRERADLRVRAGQKDLRFQVTGVTVLSGNLTASAIFSRVRPQRPNFILRGKQALIERVVDARPGDRLRILGAWRPGSRDLLVSSVEAPKAASEPAKP